MLTQKHLKECMTYDPNTGMFIWRERPLKHFKTKVAWKTVNKRLAGKPAGCVVKASGYIRIGIDGKDYHAHRLAFLYMTGSMPFEEVDHVNHYRSDNRFTNLRAISRLDNSRNMGKRLDNNSGTTGVHWNKKDKRWVAQIRMNNKTKHLGMFVDKERAVSVRKAAEKQFGYHNNHGG